MARPRSFDPDAVVDQCVEQFWSSGYGTTSTDDLCTGSQLSRSSLYNTFGSKRELYLTALRRYAGRKQQERAELIERELTGRELVREIGLRVLTDQWDDDSRRACLGINACIEVGPHDDEITPALELNAAAFDEMLAVAVRRGRVDGTIRSDVPADALARTVHAALDGLQVRSRVAPDRSLVLADLDTLLALL